MGIKKYEGRKLIRLLRAFTLISGLFFKRRKEFTWFGRNLKCERVQIENQELDIDMFDIDRKHFESLYAFMKAPLAQRHKFYKAGYSYNGYKNLPDNACEIMAMISKQVRSKSVELLEQYQLTTLRMVLFSAIKRLDTIFTTPGEKPPEDGDFSFCADLILHIKTRLENSANQKV